MFSNFLQFFGSNEPQKTVYPAASPDWGNLVKESSTAETPEERRRLALQAFDAGHYNAAIEIMKGDYRSLPDGGVLVGILLSIGDFEHAYYLLEMAIEHNPQVLEEPGNNKNMHAVLNDVLQIKERLQEMDFAPLREEYYRVQPSREYSDGQYAEVYAADHFIRNFGPGRAAVMQGIRTLQSSGSAHECAMGYAYEAYFKTQHGRWLEGAELYIRAATRLQDHAFYYGYAGRAIAKQLRLPGARQDLVLWTKAAILQRRAIRLDFTNARWHYYQALNLRHLAPLLAQCGRKGLAQYLLLGADDEMSLAEAMLREDQVGMRGHVEHEKNRTVQLP